MPDNEAAESRAQKATDHFACPFCNSFDVSRLYIASVGIDSCECLTCGARWDQERATGKYCGRSDRTSVLAPRQNR